MIGKDSAFAWTHPKRHERSPVFETGEAIARLMRARTLELVHYVAIGRGNAWEVDVRTAAGQDEKRWAYRKGGVWTVAKAPL